jgi:hypothetical protein
MAFTAFTNAEMLTGDEFGYAEHDNQNEADLEQLPRR